MAAARPRPNHQCGDDRQRSSQRWRLTLAGLGLARLAAFQVKDDIAAGRLQTVLEDFNPGDRVEVHAVFLGQGGYLPSRVRALLDFLVEKVRLD